MIAALLAGSGILSGCTKKTQWAATFFQPWKQHADMSEQDWSKLFADIQQLGFRQIYIQWLGHTHGTDNWMLSDQTIKNLLNIANSQGMSLVIGLPYDNRWNDVLGSDSLSEISRFFDQTVEAADALIQHSSWANHSAVKGWYIPYELEQYNWSHKQKALLLADWLKTLAATISRYSNAMPSISTYCSQLQTQQTMASLWSGIIQYGAQVRPLLQDGAGVYGQQQTEELDQLQRYFQSQKITFDLIIELFQQQQPISKDLQDFTAVSASPDRIKHQLRRFEASGARHAIAFAAYPWLTNETETAEHLRSQWDSLGY
ncbi:DUF4434 domain-containing protein [Castellaniella sp.]|uniref:DUF4434 domain-containing protein n=1 Tax=Castellaniella sp. TaxID=1955812 RepID=UPI002AFF8192|nr:DUF4434 domain-containing protein [Castellaniella sp.]